MPAGTSPLGLTHIRRVYCCCTLLLQAVHPDSRNSISTHYYCTLLLLGRQAGAGGMLLVLHDAAAAQCCCCCVLRRAPAACCCCCCCYTLLLLLLHASAAVFSGGRQGLVGEGVKEGEEGAAQHQHHGGRGVALGEAAAVGRGQCRNCCILQLHSNFSYRYTAQLLAVPPIRLSPTCSILNASLYPYWLQSYGGRL